MFKEVLWFVMVAFTALQAFIWFLIYPSFINYGAVKQCVISKEWCQIQEPRLFEIIYEKQTDTN